MSDTDGPNMVNNIEQVMEVPIESMESTEIPLEEVAPKSPTSRPTFVSKDSPNSAKLEEKKGKGKGEEKEGEKEEVGALDFKDTKEKKVKKFSLPEIPTQKILEVLLNFLVPLICLSISGGLAILVLIPSHRDIPSLEASLAIKTQLSSQLERKVASLKELVDFSNQVEEYSLVVNKALISEPKIPELLAQIDLMVRESGLNVDSLNYSQASTVESTGMSLVDVSLSATGSFDKLVSFMKSIENASRLVLLKDFRYSLAEKDGAWTVSASFQLQAPYLFVSSSAVTDEPIELSISSQEFLADMRRILDLHQYEVSESDQVVYANVEPQKEPAPETIEPDFNEPIPVEPLPEPVGEPATPSVTPVNGVSLE
jgi:Tfp pilus assembly protein PilO